MANGGSSIPLHAHGTSTWKLDVKKGSLGWSTRRYGSLHRSTAATRKLGQTSSNMVVDTQVNTQAFSKDETVKEEFTETKTEEIERIELGSNKICIRDDLVKNTMMFSEESSQAIFDMGNAESIELKKSSFVVIPGCFPPVGRVGLVQLGGWWDPGNRFGGHGLCFNSFRMPVLPRCLHTRPASPSQRVSGGDPNTMVYLAQLGCVGEHVARNIVFKLGRRQLRSGRVVFSPTATRAAPCVEMGSTLCLWFGRQARAEMGPVWHNVAWRVCRSGSKRCAQRWASRCTRGKGRSCEWPHFGGRSRQWARLRETRAEKGTCACPQHSFGGRSRHCNIALGWSRLLLAFAAHFSYGPCRLPPMFSFGHCCHRAAVGCLLFHSLR